MDYVIAIELFVIIYLIAKVGAIQSGSTVKHAEHLSTLADLIVVCLAVIAFVAFIGFCALVVQGIVWLIFDISLWNGIKQLFL